MEIETSDRPLLHVVPTAVRRGAQVYANQLVVSLERQHRAVTIFGTEPAIPGSDCLGLPDGRLRSLGLDLRAVVALRRYVRAINPGITVAHGGEALKYLALAREVARPFIYLAIGTVPPGFEERIISRRLYTWSLNSASAIVAVSEDVAEETQRIFGVSDERLRVIPNGREPGDFPAASHHAELPCDVIFVGHLTAQKRPELFLRAVAALRSADIPHTASIVGDGPLAPSLTDSAEEMQVKMLGRRHDVADLLARSGVLVFTSEPAGEGMPGVLIEAGMAGVPVVACRGPGVESVVLHGRTGFVVDQGDHETLVQRIAELIRSPELRRDFGDRAREHCSEHFSVRTTVTAWKQLLEQLEGEPADSGAARRSREAG